MNPDDELCLCFHVSRRKVENYLRVERVRAASQLSECHGAGTGCGWCRPFLRRLFEAHCASTSGAETAAELPTPEAYAAERADYVRQGGGAPPPGATPIE
ncbi:BFD-like [2Fe-2S] binding domain protein [Pseudobythopirellula maris]|uniref:BFD-like [2Fe-2S] binding domain protein n=1 Tax=Pseudobythopirellula maris TaxID=2527991 RepID=A0A5C5ZND8_9BACT|nr:(2Fe-2S)-binding protein [Pseudobythopirellula maris]TWT88680.1 BFD-like [2Fe-2S] binding domain protein [Pseudobythopirellula maris]